MKEENLEWRESLREHFREPMHCEVRERRLGRHCISNFICGSQYTINKNDMNTEEHSEEHSKERKHRPDERERERAEVVEKERGVAEGLVEV